MSCEQSSRLAPSEGDYQQFGDTEHTKKLPPSLECLLHHLYQNEIKTRAEYLIAIICYLLLESGLVPASISSELCSKVRTHWGFSFVAGIPKNGWKSVADEITQKYMELHRDGASPMTDHIYTLKFKLLNHSDEELQLIVRKVFGGSSLCVTLCAEHHQQSASIMVPVNDFVNDITEAQHFDQIRHEPMHFILKSRILSTQTKEQLIGPVRNVIMYDSAYPNAALNGLPKEILWSLFQYLRYDLETLQKISHSCVYLRNLALTFLAESKIQLKHRRPTPITYDDNNQIQPRSRRRFYNVYPWMFDPFNYSFNF